MSAIISAAVFAGIASRTAVVLRPVIGLGGVRLIESRCAELDAHDSVARHYRVYGIHEGFRYAGDILMGEFDFIHQHRLLHGRSNLDSDANAGRIDGVSPTPGTMQISVLRSCRTAPGETRGQYDGAR